MWQRCKRLPSCGGWLPAAATWSRIRGWGFRSVKCPLRVQTCWEGANKAMGSYLSKLQSWNGKVECCQQVPSVGDVNHILIYWMPSSAVKPSSWGLSSERFMLIKGLVWPRLSYQVAVVTQLRKKLVFPCYLRINRGFGVRISKLYVCYLILQVFLSVWELSLILLCKRAWSVKMGV